MTDGLPTTLDQVLVLGLALRGVALGSHLITYDNVVWRG